MKKYGDVEIRKAKTDAIRIVKYAVEKKFEIKRYEDQDVKYNDLKFLSRQYNQTVSILVKSKIQFNNLLDEIMLGINMISLKSLGILKKSDLKANKDLWKNWC